MPSDLLDTLEQIAYRRGKADGYSVGLVDGWDACMRHVVTAFDNAIAFAIKEPEAVAEHRKAVLEAQKERQ